MEIETLIELAHAMHTRPGVYALLLGSGISRAAGIPTGHEVTLELIRRLAALEGDATPVDPVVWFQERYREAPSYSAILERLAPLPAERQGQLRPFFEPTEAERADGRKVPTAAHRAIAGLVARGQIRVIVTTNFDRLLEQSLQDEGMAPVVIHNPDSAAGAPPLVHSRCTVVKLHGDYLDTRIKNTVTELGSYEPALDALLDRVLDEYGLIVCGWSGEWDEALRRSLERAPSRRYSTYWTSRGEPGPTAQRLITQRDARVVRIEDADRFFGDLCAKIAVLNDLARPHPLSTVLAVAELKRYITRPEDRIRLNDLLTDATDAAEAACVPIHAVLNAPVSGPELAERLTRYEAAVDPLLNLLVMGVYFGDPEHANLWIRMLTRLSALPLAGGYDAWINARRYPALLAFYACGIAAVAAGRYDTLASVMTGVRVRDGNSRQTKSLLESTLPNKVIHAELAKAMPGHEREYTPTQNRLHQQLALIFTRIASGEEFEELFDRWEYLYGLIVACRKVVDNDEHKWIPVGRYGWRSRGTEDAAGYRIRHEIETLKDMWPPFQARLFDGTVTQVLESCAVVEDQITRRQWF